MLYTTRIKDTTDFKGDTLYGGLLFKGPWEVQVSDKTAPNLIREHLLMFTLETFLLLYLLRNENFITRFGWITCVIYFPLLQKGYLLSLTCDLPQGQRSQTSF